MASDFSLASDRVDSVAVDASSRGEAAARTDPAAGGRTAVARILQSDARPPAFDSEAAIGGYVDKAREIAAQWPKLTLQDRVGGLLAAANESLARVGVPPVQPSYSNPNGASAAFFAEDWAMRFDLAFFSKPEIGPDEASLTANIVYHECRHAEQFFTMARLCVAERWSTSRIEEKLGVKKSIVEKAAAMPLDRASPEAKLAAEWRKTVLDPATAELERKAGEINSDPELVAACQVLLDPAAKDDAKAKARAVVAKAQEALAAYAALPIEKDAYEVGGKVTDAYQAR